MEQRSIGKESTQGNQRGNGDFVGPENGDTFFDVMCERPTCQKGVYVLKLPTTRLLARVDVSPSWPIHSESPKPQE